NSDPTLTELPTWKPRDASASPSKQFRAVADIDISDDGLVYVTDQKNNRIQVFTKQGKFQREFFVAPKTQGPGAAWGTALSRDTKQTYLFVADGASGVIRVLSRADGREIGKISQKGRNAGSLENPNFVVVDSYGTLYTGEHHFTRSWDGWQASHTGAVDT